MNTLRHLLPSVLLVTSVLVGCGKSETLLYESGPIQLSAEGPIFEGSNTAQGSWDPGLEAFLKDHGATPDQLRGARVLSAMLSASDDTGFSGIRSASVMLASDASDMQQVAVLNPFPKDQERVELTVANEQKGLVGHLQQETVTVVADLDIDADSDDDRHVIGSFTIELTIKR
jgi:hypothetical protein